MKKSPVKRNVRPGSLDMSVIFKRLGLPKHASSLYEVLWNDGPMLAAHVARSARCHRPSAYLALRELIRIGFVTVSQKKGRKLYHAENPDRIPAAFADASARLSADSENLVPRNPWDAKSGIRTLEGFEGIREAFDDVIRHTPRGETFYRYTSERDLDKVNRYLSDDYRIRRDTKKLERLVISNPQSGLRKRPRLERFVKFIPADRSLFDHDIIQLIYGKRVSFIDLNCEKVLTIENQALADFQKVIFEQLYRKL
jgi:sugar-specific transcriptional regulator TrmB